MSVFDLFTSFRAAWSERTFLTPGTLEFVAPDRMIAAGGGDSFTAAGFQAGMKVQASGTGVDATVNANIRTIDSLISASEIETVEQDISTLAAGAGRRVDATFRDPDGLETWPVALVRSGGFDGGFTGFPAVYDGDGFSVSINAGAADAVFGVDEYDWYLSQRTDEPSKQYWTVTQFPDAPLIPESYSGSIVFAHTALAESEFGISIGTLLTSAQTVNLFRKMALYVRRRSDGAIQWVDLLRTMVANT